MGNVCFLVWYWQKVKWYFGVMILDTDNQRLMEGRGSRHSLIIRKVQHSDFGNYSCEVMNYYSLFIYQSSRNSGRLFYSISILSCFRLIMKKDGLPNTLNFQVSWYTTIKHRKTNDKRNLLSNWWWRRWAWNSKMYSILSMYLHRTSKMDKLVERFSAKLF